MAGEKLLRGHRRFKSFDEFRPNFGIFFPYSEGGRPLAIFILDFQRLRIVVLVGIFHFIYAFRSPPLVKKKLE